MSREKSSQRVLWYTRRDGVVRGPYPQKQISRYILLGRIRDSDELMPADGGWDLLGAYPDLIPEVMKLPPTEENYQKLLRARMREDERQPGDRRDRDTDTPEHIKERRSGADRRRPEVDDVLRYRELKFQVSHTSNKAGKQYRYPVLVAVLVLLGFAISYALETVEPDYLPPDCTSAPRPGVNWDNCNQIGLVANKSNLVGAHIRSARMDSAQLYAARLTGAELQYTSLNLSNLQGADLSYANLLGVTLRGSDLRDTRLIKANLSYANLSGASIEGADFTDAILDHTIWVDQQPCAPGSIGVCKRYKNR
jgi:hypothetical protein